MRTETFNGKTVTPKKVSAAYEVRRLDEVYPIAEEVGGVVVNHLVFENVRRDRDTHPGDVDKADRPNTDPIMGKAEPSTSQAGEV